MNNFLIKQNKQLTGFRAGDDTLIKEIIHPKNDPVDLPYSLAWGSLEAGSSSLPHILENEELYYILEGEALIYVENEGTKVGKGDSLLVFKGKSQYVKNVGNEKLVFLCIVSPAWEESKEEILIKK